MTKKVLSTVAAAMLAASFIGCGGGSSDSSSTSSSSATGVDGLIANADVVVNILKDDDNKTIYSKTLARTYNTANYIEVNGTNANDGKYSFPVDALNALKDNANDRVISITLNPISDAFTVDKKLYNSTFIDKNGNGVKDDGELAPKPYTMPYNQGFSMLTPNSTLVAKTISDYIAAGDYNESNVSEVVALNTQKIADAIGVTPAQLQTLNPMDKNAPAQLLYYNTVVVPGLIESGKDAGDIVDELTKLPKATTMEEALANAATLANKVGDTNIENAATEALSNYKIDPTAWESALKSAPDNSRKNFKDGSGALALATSADVDFNITDTSGKSGAKGYKLKVADLSTVTTTFAANDVNISNKSMAFVIKVSNPATYAAEGDANASSVTIVVPFEINSTNGVVDAVIPADAMIKYSGVSASKSEYVSGEGNTTSSLLSNATNLLSISNGVLTVNAKQLVIDIDNNTSNALFSGFPADINNLQVAVVTNGATQTVDGDNNTTVLAVPELKITSAKGDIVESGLSVYNFTSDTGNKADMRGTVTRANADGNASVQITAVSDSNINKHTASDNYTTDMNATNEANLTLQFKTNGDDANFEKKWVYYFT
jgi:hypothetical protein